jgi:hypothetical protein
MVVILMLMSQPLLSLLLLPLLLMVMVIMLVCNIAHNIDRMLISTSENA